MNQEMKEITVQLKKNNDDDLLEFIIDDGYVVNLDSDSSQNDLKIIFSKLLKEMLHNPIKLKLTYSDDYKSGLYIDVCEEYIKELNKEINQVYKKIPVRYFENTEMPELI